jgi:hypothetical protein
MLFSTVPDSHSTLLVTVTEKLLLDADKGDDS